MGEVVVTRHIDAPPERVFDLSTDLGSWADVLSGVTKVEVLSDGPVGVGTRFRETRLMFGKEATEEMEFTAFERPTRYVVEADNHGAHYWTELRMTPEGGGTRVDLTFQAKPQTLMAKLMSFLMKPMMKSVSKALNTDLDEIKASMEGGN